MITLKELKDKTGFSSFSEFRRYIQDGYPKSRVDSNGELVSGYQYRYRIGSGPLESVELDMTGEELNDEIEKNKNK